MLIVLAFSGIIIMSSSTVQAQDNQRPEKPTIDKPMENYLQTNDALESDALMPVTTSTDLSSEMGYWSHITTQNTGNLPFGESIFYAYPRYWNYIFVDSNNRYLVDSGGLFVWNGAYWRAVTADGEQITRVREIVEDDNGNLWLGTIDELIQLNSALQFVEKYTTANSNLKKNDINTLWIEDDGSLWVGHRWDENTGGGVTIFNEQVIDSLDGYTNDIIQRDNGDVWVAQAPDEQGNYGSIYVYRPSNDSSWSYTEDNSGLPHSEVDNFSEDSQGNIWMGHYATQHHPMGGVTKFDGTDWTHFNQDDGLPQGGAWYTYAASDDKVYYTTNDSIMVYENESWSHFINGNDRFPLRGSTIITEDRDNNLVIGADPGADLTGGGIHIYDGSSWEFISNHTDGGLFSNVIFGADVDTDGNIWVSGFYGVAMYDGESWTYFSENDGLSNTYAWKLLAASDGSIWFGMSQNGAVTQYVDGSFTVYDNYKGFEETIFEDSQGNIWFGAWDWKNQNKEGGILKYNGSDFTVYDDSDGLIGENVTAIGEGPDGNIYASTFAGVAVFDGSSWSEFSVDGQTGVGANELASDSDGNLWIDTGGVVKKWDGSNWTTYDESDGYMGSTTHIEPAGDGSIWLAGNKVQVIRDGQIFDMTPNANYQGTTSYVITHDDEGAAWVGTYGNGIFKHDMSEGLVIESIEDYPEDQGGWVTVKAGGFLMDPYNISDVDYDPTSWVVQRKNGDNWENAGTSFEFSEGSNQMSVQVPTTMPTDEDLDEHKYDFRIGVYSSSDEVIGYSDPVTAHALDNLAPGAVDNIAAERGTDEVTMSWSPPSDNDIKQYEIFAADNSEDTPLATTHSTQITLPDTEYSGVQKLEIRARDRHENIGSASDPAIAVFPMNQAYEVDDEEQWRLIGLPLDADANDVSALESQIKEGALYEFDGSYQAAEEIEPGKGYWAKFDAGGSYEIPGLPLVEQTIDIKKGWNLISGIGTSYDYNQIQDPEGILVEGTLSTFDGGYTETNVLNPGEGYWLRASEPGTITFSLLESSSAATQQKEIAPLVEAKEKLNKVKIQMSEGGQQVLYFGNELPDQVDPLSFSMPPQAPGNVFDVRLAEGDTRFTSSDKFSMNIETSESAAITLDLELLPTHPHQQYLVQELKGGKVLAEHTVTPEKNIALRNNDVTTLKMIPSGLEQQTEGNVPDEFDLVGRKVSTLVGGEQQEAGTHTVRFDASSLSSGVYFVRLQAGSFNQIQKITLIK